jgi:hypothetical protein
LSFGCGADQNDEIISNLIQAGYPADDIMVVDGLVYVGRDAHVTLEASREMIQVVPGSTDEQYRTTNLVGGGVSKICINPSGTFNNYANISSGLNGAISNYNSLGLQFTLARGPTTGCSANITIRISGTSPGGSSGFPSGGSPYGTINIGSGTNSYSVNVNKHVITHEIGHTVGMRHSDYYNRSISCGGSPTNEGSAGIGAILIPGTPSNATVGGSIMNSCFRSTETGNWTSTDKTAMWALY